MATVNNTLFPPVIATFAKAFLYDEDAKIYFSISQYNSPSSIKRVHVTVINQLNNENALTDRTGVLFEDLQFDDQEKQYYVTIPASMMRGQGDNPAGQFNINQYYKVQVRFDNRELTSSESDKAYGDSISNSMTVTAKQNYLLNETTHFSEWSSVCLIRGIQHPHISTTTFNVMTGFNKGVIPIVGTVYFGPKADDDSYDTVETETMQSYKIDIINNAGASSEDIVATSGMIYTGQNLDPNDINYNMDLQTLPEDIGVGSQLVCRITVTTKDLYIFSKDFKFEIGDYDNVEEFDPNIDVTVDNEEGIVSVHVTNSKNITGGTCYVKRLSSDDNFTVAQTIRTKRLDGQIDFTINDNTVSSLCWYRYSVQYKTKGGMLTPVTYSDTVMPNFYDAIISRGTQQYAIRYNYSISSYKPNVNRTKIDTLGSKYPRFAENAVMNYKQFNISGIISAEADAYQKFLKKYDDRTRTDVNDGIELHKGVYSESDKLQSYYETYLDNPNQSIIKTNGEDDEFNEDSVKSMIRNDFQKYKKFDDMAPLTNDNLAESHSTTNSYLTTTYNDWMWEREFREQMIQWLNDGEPKLYRSKQEGSMAVMLTDISLTPTSGRRFTYNFTATMYEVGPADNLAQLDAWGIFDVRTEEEDIENGKDDNKDYTKVEKIGQIYQFQIVSSDTPDLTPNQIRQGTDIKGVILDQLHQRYGFTGSEDGTNYYDTKSVLGKRDPQNVHLKNIKIYFQSKPTRYWFNEYGTLETDAVSQDNPDRFVLGYSFNISTEEGANASSETIFVNDRGYYQVPDSLDVTRLVFNHPGDVVTIEYAVTYEEHDSSTEIITGATTQRTVVGQQSGMFLPDNWYGDIIKEKYNYLSGDNYRYYMQYWRGICLDVTPYALCKIEYHNVDGDNEYMVGGTGVLHMLKDFNVDNICFEGIRMSIVQDKSRQKYLKDWECYLDPSALGGEYSAKTFNWFTIQDVDTGDKVEIHSDDQVTDQITDEIVPINSLGTRKTNSNGTFVYSKISDIAHPRRNTVYGIGEKLQIYYIDGNWYDFEYTSRDETNVTANTATEPIGIAKVPVEGYINYYGTVIKTTYNS